MSDMLSINPHEIVTRDLHQFIVGIVAPRPIAWVSTISPEGQVNLAPFSFFNAFSSNPPIVVFSANRTVEDNKTKDTLHNIQATKECVIHSVPHHLVRQMALTSIHYPSEVNEFEKAGLTAIPSDIVRPPRILESPTHMECKVYDIITLGSSGGAGHLILCEVVKLHIDKQVIDEHNRIDPEKLDLMGRMGRSYYARAAKGAIETIVQTIRPMGIGFDGLPSSILHSQVLTGNDIGYIAGHITELPAQDAVAAVKTSDPRIAQILSKNNAVEALHYYAKELLSVDDVPKAINVLMIADAL